MEKLQTVSFKIPEAALVDILTNGMVRAEQTWSDNYEPLCTWSPPERLRSVEFRGPLRADWDNNVKRAAHDEPRTIVNLATIAAVLGRMACGEFADGGSDTCHIFADIMRGMRNGRCEADHSLCDCVLQCALFGSIVYG